MSDSDEARASDEHDLGDDALARVKTKHKNFTAFARLRKDGRVNVKFRDHAFKISKYLEKTARHTKPKAPLGETFTSYNKKFDSNHQDVLGKFTGIPRINIAIHIVGSRGDVQPFIAIAKELQKEPYNHRVRICTHPVFKDFVEENGVEFFSIGGDPAELMAYMVRNPGLMPGLESLKSGDVGKRRKDIANILEGCWRGCIEPGNGMGHRKTAAEIIHEPDTDKLFIADAIIANPPSYAHIHCAERLGIPLHMMFTMPWSPTQQFPHPLASLDRNESDPHFANYISYTMMELLAWQGLGDVINGFRCKTLHLDPISPLWGHMLLSRMKVPFTYLWSSTLIPKPPDWGSYINISGFVFLNQASSYTPPEDLIAFLKAGPPPVYIGFGSVVVDDPEKLTKLIFGAVKRAGVRALVSKGWGGLGGEHPPEGIHLLGNCPHDWLFKYVSAVVHHGGAGTTAIGIAMGKPTVVVPFFGDQPFWGAMIHRAGAGPEPVSFKKMTEESLAHSITLALQPEVQTAVKRMSEQISQENGAANVAASFHRAINMDTMRCLICPDRVAVWRVKRTNIRLSSLAAAVLLDQQIIRLQNLKLIKQRDWYIDEGASGPFMGIVAVASGAMTSAVGIIVSYSRALSHTFSKNPSSKDPLDTSFPAPESPQHIPLTTSESLNYFPSHNPVQRAATYSPTHLEYLAHRMAHKTLPTTASKKRHRRTYEWSPIHRTTSPLHYPTYGTNHGHEDEHGQLYDASVETGHFIHDMATLGFKVPVSFFYNIANGLHNAPSFLFNDDTVRRRKNITGLGSGFRVAGREIVFGLFDGFTGLVYQPYLGAIKGSKTKSTLDHHDDDGEEITSGAGLAGGVLGFGKGIGKGLGGLVCKTGAAAFGIPGYTLKGLEREMEKRHLRDLKGGMLAVRLKQGITEFARSTELQREEVLKRWREGGFGV